MINYIMMTTAPLVIPSNVTHFFSLGNIESYIKVKRIMKSIEEGDHDVETICFITGDFA